jgi:hypothetical protein
VARLATIPIGALELGRQALAQQRPHRFRQIYVPSRHKVMRRLMLTAERTMIRQGHPTTDNSNGH